MLPLSEYDIRALHVALEHEDRSLALHDRIIRDFGPTPLIEDTRDVRTGHIQVLEWLLIRRYGSPYRNIAGVYAFRNSRTRCTRAQRQSRQKKNSLSFLPSSNRKRSRPGCTGELSNLERAARNGHLPRSRGVGEATLRTSACARRRSPGARRRERLRTGSCGKAWAALAALGHGPLDCRGRLADTTWRNLRRARPGLQFRAYSKHASGVVLLLFRTQNLADSRLCRPGKRRPVSNTFRGRVTPRYHDQ